MYFTSKEDRYEAFSPYTLYYIYAFYMIYIGIYQFSANRHHFPASITICKKERYFSGIFFDISKVFSIFATD